MVIIFLMGIKMLNGTQLETVGNNYDVYISDISFEEKKTVFHLTYTLYV